MNLLKKILKWVVITSILFTVIIFILGRAYLDNNKCGGEFASKIAISGCAVKSSDKLYIPTIHVLNGGMLQLIATKKDNIDDLNNVKVIKALSLDLIKYSNEAFFVSKNDFEELNNNFLDKDNRLIFCRMIAENKKYNEEWHDFYGVHNYGVQNYGDFNGILCTKTVTEGEAIIMSVMFDNGNITNMESWIVKDEHLQADISTQLFFLQEMLGKTFGHRN